MDRDRELLAWAASVIQREQAAGTFGVVAVHMERGRIARVKVERTEVPEGLEKAGQPG